MILVGDVGATNTRFALANLRDGEVVLSEITVYPSADESGLEPHLARFLRACDVKPEAVALGLPGPVREQRVHLTNLTWEIDGSGLADELGLPVTLLNDLEAAAWGLLAAGGRRPEPLLDRTPGAGARVLLVPGTGLGEALLVRDGDGFLPCPTEGGHTDFGPRCDEEVALWRFLHERFGHVSFERILSGPGLALLHEFYRGRGLAAEGAVLTPPQVVRAALASSCPAALAAVNRFAAVLGAEAANLTLKALATGGVYIGGGIAPRVLESLGREAFEAGFTDKGRYRSLLESVPVHLVKDPHLGLRGAARAAGADS